MYYFRKEAKPFDAHAVKQIELFATLLEIAIENSIACLIWFNY